MAQLEATLQAVNSHAWRLSQHPRSILGPNQVAQFWRKQLIVLGPQEPLALSQAESRAVARALHEKDDLVRRSLNVARFLVKVKAAY